MVYQQKTFNAYCLTHKKLLAKGTFGNVILLNDRYGAVNGEKEKETMYNNKSRLSTKKSSCKYFEKITIHVSVSIYKYAWC